MQHARQTDALSQDIERLNAAAEIVPAIRRSDQTREIDIRELAARITGSDRLREGQPDTYAQRLMKQLSGINVA